MDPVGSSPNHVYSVRQLPDVSNATPRGSIATPSFKTTKASSRFSAVQLLPPQRATAKERQIRRHGLDEHLERQKVNRFPGERGWS
jgi:hypothetical protein